MPDLQIKRRVRYDAAFVLKKQLCKSGEFFLSDFDIRCTQEIDGVFVGTIGNAIYDPGNAGVDQCLRALEAGQVSDITGRTFCRDSMQRRLDNGIRLGMDGADAMPIHKQVPGLVTVGLSRRRAIESCGQDALIEHQHATDECPVTGAAL